MTETMVGCPWGFLALGERGDGCPTEPKSEGVKKLQVDVLVFEVIEVAGVQVAKGGGMPVYVSDTQYLDLEGVWLRYRALPRRCQRRNSSQPPAALYQPGDST